jgi:hypothetical protein
MTVTRNLPEDGEQAFLAEAHACGWPLDEFISRVLVTRIADRQPVSNVRATVPLEREEGVPVFRTGQPLAPSVVDDTLRTIRRERDNALLGLGA